MNPLSPHTLRVAIDVGCDRHFVAVGLPDGKLLDEFNIGHDRHGFDEFFQRIATKSMGSDSIDFR